MYYYLQYHLAQIQLGSVTISGNNFSNIIPVVYSTTTLAIGVQAELSWFTYKQ